MTAEKILSRSMNEQRTNNFYSHASCKAEAIKDLAEVFKTVCEIDDNDNFLKQLAEMPKSSKDVTIQPILQVDDGVFGLCD